LLLYVIKMWASGKQIVGKEVIRAEGRIIGKVIDVKFNKDGDLISIIVKVPKEIQKENWWNEIIEIPTNKIGGIGKYVIIKI